MSRRPSSIEASGQQRHAGLQVADVADDHRPGAVLGELAVVDGDLDPDRGEHQRLQAREDVGDPADLLLDVLVDALHERGVEAHPGHHHEVGVLHAVAADLDHVDRPVLPGQGDVDRRPDEQRDVQVAGEQVAGACRDDADRDAGARQLGAHLTHGAVAAADEHQVGAVDRGRLGHAGAGVLDGRVVPPRRQPARLLGDGGDDGLERLDVLDLDRVEDDRQVAVARDGRRQRLGPDRVALRQRGVDPQPEQDHGRTQQGSAHDVGGVVPAQQDAVQADDGGHQHRAGVGRPTQVLAADEHGDQHDHDAREGDGGGGVPGRVGLRRQQVLAQLPLRALAAHEQLDDERRHRGRDHHACGEDGRSAVALDPHGDGERGGHDRHADGAEEHLDPPQGVVEPLVGSGPRRPRGRRVLTLVEADDRAPALDHGDRDQDEQPEQHRGAGELHAAGSVEHGRQYDWRDRRSRISDESCRSPRIA